MLLFWIPLDMPLKFTLSWMKGAQTIEATSVKQLADAGVRVGDTLRISGTECVIFALPVPERENQLTFFTV